MESSTKRSRSGKAKTFATATYGRGRRGRALWSRSLANRAPSRVPPPSLNVRTGGYNGLELKFIDAKYSGAIPLLTTGATALEADIGGGQDCLFCPTQGAGPSDREGRKATVKSLFMHGSVYLPVVGAVDAAKFPGPVHIYVVLDTQTNKQQSNSEDILQGSTSVLIQPFQNLSSGKRFRILAHKVIYPRSPPSFTTDDLPQQVYPFTISLPKLNVETCFAENSAVIGAITDNSLHCLAFYQAPAASTLTSIPQLTYNVRCRFVG